LLPAAGPVAPAAPSDAAFEVARGGGGDRAGAPQASLLRLELRYCWSVIAAGAKRLAYGDNALTDDLSWAVKYESHGTHLKVGWLQMQGAIRALMVARGMTPPAAISGKEQQPRS
jgi:hypothetical protein